MRPAAPAMPASGCTSCKRCSARHEAREAALVALAYLIDYIFKAMRALPELVEERGGTAKGCFDVVRARKRVVEANVRHQSQDATCGEEESFFRGFCYALVRMRPLSIPYAECSVVISCGKVDYDKSG
jgi:hypothetical protein